MFCTNHKMMFCIIAQILQLSACSEYSTPLHTPSRGKCWIGSPKHMYILSTIVKSASLS